ncbi:MAG: RluA family pseudouridine synthase [Gemmatimonadales bacterium]
MRSPEFFGSREGNTKGPRREAQTPPRREPIPVRTFHVAAQITERLDRYLADQLSISRTQAARLIARQAVRVNGAPARASKVLGRGDAVEVELGDEEPPRELKPHHIELAVVYEDDAMLVLDKPAGLVVHPAPGHWSDTLLNALVARGTPLSAGSSGRPGIIHRLDKDTSGLLVVAKTDQAHRRLANAIARRQVLRLYAVLMWGHLGEAIDIDAPIARHPKDRKRMAVLATGRPARTHVEPVARFDTCDLVRVRLTTGRTHQVRIHLLHLGHPVVGDPVYGGGGAERSTGAQRPRALAVEKAAPRQALHAAVLRIPHPTTGELREFRSEWPLDLVPALVQASGDRTLLDRPHRLEYLRFFERDAPSPGRRE